MIPHFSSPDNPLRVVRLTPSGRGAVASILLQGTGAAKVFARRWTGPNPVADRPVFGRFRLEDSDQVEQMVVHGIGPEEIEMHCHGGQAIVEAVEASLIHDGATPVSWIDFYGSGDAQQDRALRLLPFASTERTARIILDQFNGALERELDAIGHLTDEAEKDRHLARLEENALLGRHLVEPFQVVLAGATNAGKSSLLNAILGFKRSIVAPTPGTTRDVVSARTALDGFPVEFYDTAGFRCVPADGGHGDLERLGIERSSQSLAGADLVVWVVDASVSPDNELPAPESDNVLVCFNKSDLVEPPPLNGVSAATGEGVEALLERIVRRLVPHPPEALEGVPLPGS